jgi:hypothetical protein
MGSATLLGQLYPDILFKPMYPPFEDILAAIPDQQMRNTVAAGHGSSDQQGNDDRTGCTPSPYQPRLPTRFVRTFPGLEALPVQDYSHHCSSTLSLPGHGSDSPKPVLAIFHYAPSTFRLDS